jgi:aryl-alcohol dehydrogenase-like predicted oxidoreductase
VHEQKSNQQRLPWADITTRRMMRTRTIGTLEVSAVGFGEVGYGPGVSDDEAIDLVREAFHLGCTFYDTAEGYAHGDNEQPVGRALAPRDQVVIATKFFIGDEISRAQLGTQIMMIFDHRRRATDDVCSRLMR